LIKYIKSVLWRVAKCLSYVQEARCLKVKEAVHELSYECYSVRTVLLRCSPNANGCTTQ